ncbi:MULTISPECIES: DUF6691 family protein [unclassified Beijerinckia]|uniref:DUF6691 family protein n=1 Tax=unclassified Beijerinckia TaxID=2638183 RepID=UPI00089C0F6B|nr:MULTISPECIES: DUF6691 family protein [unclassified Beijerinckia]MDH7795386.1 putative membrane protein YedE/YeeE [Beijerinckia sp. GAS462]SEB99447.1 hypothetical protein SAMN05443249_1659 [Beijerinckia sp. 28-YEA-48]
MMARLVIGLVAGVLFGFGLALSGMLDPARVRGFLDVTGDWNPSLAFVLAGAVIVAALGQAWARRRATPFFDKQFGWPPTRPVTTRLIVGSALFGIGWGLVGLCPGPAIAGLSLGLAPIAIFAAAMLVGMLLFTMLPTRA